MLVLLAGLLLAVALSGPVEALHRRKVPRTVASVSVVLILGGYLLLPALADQVWQLVSTLPFALKEIGEFFERATNRIGLSVGTGDASSLSTLAG